MLNQGICPIWGGPAEENSSGGRDGRLVDSPRAGGKYFISRHAEVNLRHEDPSVKARLTTWLVDQHRLGVDCPEIMSTTVNTAQAHRLLSAHERADRLLLWIKKNTPHIGGKLFFAPGTFSPDSDQDEVLAWTESIDLEEIQFLANYLQSEGFVSKADESSDVELITITVKGYARLADLETNVSDSKQAFVAMWFDSSMNDAYEHGIAPGISDAGYEPVRIDGKEHNNKIDDEIIAEIRRSRFLVADFTHGEAGMRGGVYYEAGFAHGLNIPVIFTCREDAIGQVHFDTRQYNHITWNTPEELRTRLANRISATIGDGPLK